RQRLADHTGIAVEVTLPQTVRDHDDRRGVVDLVFVFRVKAPQGRLDSKHLEDRWRESPAGYPFGGRAVCIRTEILTDLRERAHRFEGLALLAKRGIRRKVHAITSVLVLGWHGPDHEQGVGIFKGQGTEQRGVDQAEDYGIRADP